MLKSSELYNLILDSSNADKLEGSINSGIEKFKKGLSEKGRIAPVELQDEGENFIVTSYEILTLCNWYLQNKLDEIELEYIANLLELSEDFNYEHKIAD